MTAPTTPTARPATPPPANDATVRQVAELLLAGYAAATTAAGVAALLGLPVAAVSAALSLTARHSTHKPRAIFTRHGVAETQQAGPLQRAATEPARELLRGAAAQDAYFRAAYVAAAARRITAGLASGRTLREVVAAEARHAAAHESARANRLAVAARTGMAAGLYGNLLGWYLNPVLNNEIECITADGHNFHADEGTIIGYPGGVHPHCGCTAGPPIEGAGLVNDALRGLHLHAIPGGAHPLGAKVYRPVRRKAG